MKFILVSVLTLFIVGMVVLGCGAGSPPNETAPAEAPPVDAGDVEQASIPVHAEVTAFVLTKCPYAAELLRNLVVLREEMGPSLDISIGYVGLVDSEGNIDPGMAEAERKTAGMQICVSANADPSEWFDYLGCTYEGEEWRSLPTGWETCVSQAGISVDDVRRCVDSGNGDAILAQAYGAATASRVSGSPTVFINGFLYGQERTVAALKQYVCHVAGTPATRPAICDSVPPPPMVEATLIYDERCAGNPVCDVEGEIAVLERLIPGFKLTRTRFSSMEGRALFDAVRAADLGADKLPMVVVQDALDAQASLKALLGEYLLPFEDGYVFALGGGWDPMAEICDNGADDNGDGKTDCDDSGCVETLGCREALPRRLDLFAMSECPFTLELLPTVDRVLNHFDRDENKVDFNLQFIGDIGADDTLSSMHGQSEVEENLRMICAQSLYKKDYKFMEYILCRAKDVRSPAWEQCVPKGMSKKKIAACAGGRKGQALLKESFLLAETLGVTGSPSWILNNKETMAARRMDEIVSQFCARNEQADCEKEIPTVSGTASPSGVERPPATCN